MNLTLLFGISAVVFAAFYVFLVWADWNDGFASFFAGWLATAAAAGVGICLISQPIYRMQGTAFVYHGRALQWTYDQERCAGRLLEMATVAKQIADWNAELAEDQYWAYNPFTASFWPDAIRQAQPIRSEFC